MKKTIVIEIIIAFVVLVFSYTGMDKLLGHESFWLTLTKSPFLHRLVPLLSWTIPILELAIAVGLVFRPTKKISLYTSFFLMSLFTCYVFEILRYSTYLPCSCGGILSALNWHQHLIFNSVLTVLIAIAIISIDQKSLRNDRHVAEHL